jgi:hypothetical protein
MSNKLDIKIGSLVAMNALPDTTWFEVKAIDGMVLGVDEWGLGNRQRLQSIDRSMVKQVREKPATKAVWLVVAGMAWGKGDTLKIAFLNCMEHASSVDHIQKVALRRYTPPKDNTTTDAAFNALVYVDDMGQGYFPEGAEVSKLDIAMPNLLSKTLQRFNEAWDDFTTTETMDDAFDGDLTEGGR